jgi:hypothetical protein
MRNEYEVGHGRPPKGTQFRKGQSGNPSGRPRGSKKFLTDLEEELAQPMTHRSSEGDRVVTKQRGLIMNIIDSAVQGDPKAVSAVFRLLEQTAVAHEPSDEFEDSNYLNDMAADRDAEIPTDSLSDGRHRPDE